jgi:hypothetical protein
MLVVTDTNAGAPEGNLTAEVMVREVISSSDEVCVWLLLLICD